MISCLIRLNIYTTLFLFINLLTLARYASRRCVSGHMLPLLICLNPDEQTSSSLSEERSAAYAQPRVQKNKSISLLCLRVAT